MAKRKRRQFGLTEDSHKRREEQEIQQALGKVWSASDAVKQKDCGTAMRHLNRALVHLGYASAHGESTMRPRSLAKGNADALATELDAVTRRFMRVCLIKKPRR
jgi:hypothetical protein